MRHWDKASWLRIQKIAECIAIKYFCSCSSAWHRRQGSAFPPTAPATASQPFPSPCPPPAPAPALAPAHSILLRGFARCCEGNQPRPIPACSWKRLKGEPRQDGNGNSSRKTPRSQTGPLRVEGSVEGEATTSPSPLVPPRALVWYCIAAPAHSTISCLPVSRESLRTLWSAQ